ncbi:MAG: ABC transporter permease subunit [Planctomycetes bacterium]|nr:ABC transporter permease subunit [Planctomycetota bacterium]
MQLLWQGLQQAVQLVWAGDPLVFDAALRTILISSVAVTLATLVGVPLGVWLARARFAGNRLVVLLFRAGMALPTVFVGMVCYALFSRRGVLGPLELLYSPSGIVFGELFLAVPIIVGITHGAVQSLDPRVGETAWTLGVGPLRRGLTLISEARVGVMLAVLTAFARCVTELGIAMIVGGNIKDQTRTLATATALETGKGEFARGLAMGTILLVIALTATCLIGCLSREQRK